MTRRKVAVTLTAVLLAAAATAAQTVRQPAAPREADAIAALTAEFRALRAELAETARISLRLQLLTARIQAQEQRLIYLDRQRVDTTTRRTSHERMISGMAANTPRLTEALSTVPPEERRAIERQIEQQKRDLARQQEALAEMLVQETDAVNALAQEQARWDDLNSRLEDLEQSLR